MTNRGRLGWMLVGVLLGSMGVGWWLSRPRLVYAGNDRHEDYILCTGPAFSRPGVPTDGVWMLDYRGGKLLGTMVDRNMGKIIGWSAVDLVGEFGLPPRQNVHFLMTTGMIADNQAALYVAEIHSGKFAVYTMGIRPDGQPGLVIKRHDLTYFHKTAEVQ
jgi:hypothetical protein